MPDLPASLASLFDGQHLDRKTDVSAILATVDAEGWPHLSFLSAGEVLIQEGKILLMLWRKSRSAAALHDRGRATVFAVADGIVFELRLHIDGTENSGDDRNLIAISSLETLRRHEAPYAKVDALITFTLLDPHAAIGRWTAQSEELGNAARRFTEDRALGS